jgi:Tfp pilus assembly protein PilO
VTTTYRRIGGVAGVALVVLIAAWYLLMFHPGAKKLTEAHAARAAAQTQITQLTGQVAQLQAVERQIPTDRRSLLALEASVPDNPDLIGALNQLQAAASQTGVTVAEVGPAPAALPAAGATTAQPVGTPAITVSLNANGRYAQVMSFLRKLATMPRVFVIDHLGLSGSGGTLTATITARMFYAGTPTP